MEYQITIDGQHKLLISAKETAGLDFQVVERQIDLSSKNLFMDPNRSPDRTGAEHALLPLKQAVRDAFSLLDQVNSSSPIVSALRDYRGQRLPALLNSVDHPSPPLSIDEMAKLDALEKDDNCAALLAYCVKRIDQSLPHYFTTEKRLGSFAWLQSGGDYEKLSFQLSAPRPFDPRAASNAGAILTDLRAETIHFDAQTETASVLRDNRPDPLSVIRSLYASGTLGNEFEDLNRGAALSLVSGPLTNSLSIATELKDSLANISQQKFVSKTATALVAALPGALGFIALSIPTVANSLANTLTPFDLFRAVGMTVFLYLSASLAKGALRLRERGIELQARIKERQESGEELIPPAPVGILNTFSSAVIDHTLTMSVGRSVTSLAPRTLQSWLEDLPDLMIPDITLIPSKEIEFMGMKLPVPNGSQHKKSIHVEARDDFTGAELTADELHELYFRPAVHISHLERASETWHMLHAIELLHDFADRQQLNLNEVPWFDTTTAICHALEARTDETLTYPAVSQALAQITASLKINQETWKLIARALQAQDILERSHQRQAAQLIMQNALTSYSRGELQLSLT